MPKLILTRHGKSSWDDPLLYDHDRPLTPRGIRSSRAIGAWLSGQDLLPDQVLSSSATRAQMTAELIAEEVQFRGDFKAESGIYHASADTMLKHLRRATGQVVLMVGHNPGIADFAMRLVSNTPDHARFMDYPTAATLVAETPDDWKDARFNGFRALDFVVPRELLDPEEASQTP